MIAEDDKVAVRNHWTATDSQNGKRLAFRGIGQRIPYGLAAAEIRQPVAGRHAARQPQPDRPIDPTGGLDNRPLGDPAFHGSHG